MRNDDRVVISEWRGRCFFVNENDKYRNGSWVGGVFEVMGKMERE